MFLFVVLVIGMRVVSPLSSPCKCTVRMWKALYQHHRDSPQVHFLPSIWKIFIKDACSVVFELNAVC